MRFAIIRLSSLAFLFCFVAFGCKDDVTNSPGAYPFNLLLNSTFEMYGQPSFSDWQLSDSANIQLTSDKPAGMHGQAVVLTTPSSHDLPLALSQRIPAPYGKHVYRLSYWGKTIPRDTLELYGHVQAFFGKRYSELFEFGTFYSDTTWTFFSQVSDTLEIQKPSETGVTIIVVLFGSGNYTAWGKQYFYDCRLEILN